MQSSMEIIAPMAVLITVVIGIAFIVKTVSDNKVRQLLAQKGEINENVQYLFAKSVISSPLNSIKWGLMSVAVGAAFMIGHFAPHTFSDAGLAGLIFIFAGAALFVYYFLAKKLEEREQ